MVPGRAQLDADVAGSFRQALRAASVAVDTAGYLPLLAGIIGPCSCLKRWPAPSPRRWPAATH